MPVPIMFYICYRERPSTFKFDHVYPGSDDNKVLVVLYGELGEEGFKAFHDFLLSMTQK